MMVIINEHWLKPNDKTIVLLRYRPIRTIGQKELSLTSDKKMVSDWGLWFPGAISPWYTRKSRHEIESYCDCDFFVWLSKHVAYAVLRTLVPPNLRWQSDWIDAAIVDR